MATLHRRNFLSAGALTCGGMFLTTRVAFGGTDSATRSRLVLILMRGAVDGLSMAPPYGDPDYAALRAELAIAPPGSAAGALALDATFGLHPSLTFLHECFTAQQLLVAHAIATPYRERSHFDGQDVLESGALHPHASQSGWLNRALAALPGAVAPSERGVALGQNIPLAMRGPAAVTSWSPARLAALDEDTLQRLTDLYAHDALLSSRLADALAADRITSATGGGADSLVTPAALRTKAAQYAEIVRAAAGFLRREDGPQAAMFDTMGWDTHANEGGASGQLANRLAVLDQGLRQLRDELGPVWDQTVVVLVTEFGRTAAINGTRGTDHGTATAAFVAGGAVTGGRVLADWPGLSHRALYQERDLRPTLDLRSLLKGVLGDHLRISNRQLETQVFTDSRDARPLRGLIRA
jgi:uncharacterized protein (DUF1501 family)